MTKKDTPTTQVEKFDFDKTYDATLDKVGGFGTFQYFVCITMISCMNGVKWYNCGLSYF
jgi:hypothetical protein